MPDKILHKRSYTPGSKPTTSNLEASGEIAINVNDGKAFLRKSGSGIDTIEEFVTTNAINTGSLTISGSIIVTGSIDAYSITSSFTGSLTGSLFGTASWAVSASQAISASSAISSSYAFSASYAQNASNALTASSADEFIIRTDAFEFTGSINVSGSITLTGSLDAPTITGSLFGTSSWAVSASNAITAAFADNANTASWAISASQALTSSQAITASYALSGLSGTAATASFVTASNVWGPFGSSSIESASYASGSTSASFALFTTSASYASGSTSASFASFATSASYASGSTSASFASTASSADNFLIRNGATITGSINQTGSFTTTGTITAQTLNVQTITSSVDFVTGSTRFGSLLTNTHLFTGSVSITGSLNITGSTVASGSFTGSFTGSLTGSLLGTASWATNAITASTADAFTIRSGATISGSVNTTGSMITIGNRTITGSLLVSGSTSLTGSLGILGAVSASSLTGSHTGSFTGSLIGTASWATNAVTASTADAFVVRTGITLTGSLNQSGSTTIIGNQILSGSLTVTGSATLTGSLNILGAVSASSFTGSMTGSFTGSLLGTSSWAQSASVISSTGTNAFVQGGNSFAAAAVLGTNDNNSLAIETNGLARLFITGSDVVNTIQYLGATSASNITSMTLPLSGSSPLNGGLLENDLIIVASMHGNVSASVPTGYTSSTNALTSTGSMGYMWAYKFMGSTPDTTITNITGSTIAFAFRNVNRSIPFNVSSSVSSSTTASGMPDSPAITTTATGSMVVALGFLDRDAGFVVTAPAAYTLIGYTGSTVAANSGSIMGAYFQQTTPGTANPAAFGGTGNDYWVASTLALNPITSSGNIGINNTTPLTTLHIGSSTSPSGDFNLTNQAPVRISLPTFNTSASITEALFIDHYQGDFTSGSGAAIVMGYKNPLYGGYTSRIINYTNINKTTGTRLQIQTQKEGSNNTWNDGILINETGRVGINTTTPDSASLTVNGNIWATSITGSYTGSFNGAHTGSYTGSFNGIYTGSYTGSFTGSFVGTASWATSASNAITAAYASNADLFDGLNSTVFAITGSNTFRGDQLISGSLRVTGSAILTGSFNILGAVSASSFTGSFIGPLTGSLTGSLIGTASWATSASFISSAGNAFIQGGNSFGATALLGTNDNNNLQFETNNTVRMTITGSNGDVGIGTTNPGAKLDVAGNGTGRILVGDLFGSGNYAGISLNNTSSNTHYNFLSSPTDQSLYINRPTGNSIRFRSSNADQMILLSSGNVGIGTITPSQLLEVNGTISGSEMSFGTNQFAARKYKSTVSGITSSAYVNIGNVTGDNLASGVRMTVHGTSGNVVINSTIEILVNHFQDIVIQSFSGVYVPITVKVTSNNDANFDIAIKTTNTVAQATTVAVELFPLNSETFTFTTTPAYSSTTLEHPCSLGYNISSTGGTTYYNINNGNVGIGSTTPQRLLDVHNGLNSGIVASFGSQISATQFSGLSFGYVESANTLYRKSALVFERTDAYTGQSQNAGGKIHFLLNNNSSTSATALTDAVMTIDSNSSGTAGSVRMGVGTRSPSSSLHIANTDPQGVIIGTTTGSIGTVQLVGGASSSPTSGRLLFGADNTGWQFRIAKNVAGTITDLFSIQDATGTITVTGDVVAYGSPSDINLKTNIKPLTGSLDKVTKLQGVSFTWKEDTEVSKMTGIKDDIGFIAQEVKEIIPELVRENENGLFSLRDKSITALLVEAIKEQQKQIENLQKQINYLTENR